MNLRCQSTQRLHYPKFDLFTYWLPNPACSNTEWSRLEKGDAIEQEEKKTTCTLMQFFQNVSIVSKKEIMLLSGKEHALYV